jgi:hypothetical protein
MRKKTKMANICRSLRKKSKIYPVLKSPTHIGFIGVKKMGRKSHTWAPLSYYNLYIEPANPRILKCTKDLCVSLTDSLWFIHVRFSASEATTISVQDIGKKTTLKVHIYIYSLTSTVL